MSAKEDIIRFLQELPEELTMEEILYKLYVKAKIEEGLSQLDAEKGVPHEVAMERMSRWLN